MKARRDLDLGEAFSQCGAMGARLAQIDWSSTALGATTEWPPRLRGAVRELLGDSSPRALAWGRRHGFLCNAAAVPLVGAIYPQGLGMPLPDIVPELWPRLRQTADQGKTVWVRAGRGLASSAAGPVGILCSPLLDDAGVAGLWLAFIPAGPLERAGSRDAFLRMVDEEFRTPLTLLLGALQESLDAASAPPEHRQRVALSNRAAMRLLNQAETLFDFSRVAAGPEEAVFERVDPGPLTTELVERFRPQVEVAGLGLSVECPPLGEPVAVDRELWEKIVAHLISNAFNFTPAGGIRVTLRRVGRRAELSVADTGVGLTNTEAPALLRGARNDQARWARTREGTGLGLAVTRELVCLHRGTLRVKSAEGQGTTFTVTLPLESGPTAARQRAPRRGSRTHVVVAGSARFALRDLRERWSVDEASDGVAALATARRRTPDLVVADAAMPGLDGLALLRALRGRTRTAAVPVILIGAHPGEKPALRALEGGADDYLVRPFSRRELVARVHANLALAEARRRQREQLQAALAISQAMLAGEPTDSVLRLVARWAQALLRGDGAHVALPTRDQTRVHVTISEGRTGRGPLGATLRLDDSNHGRVFLTGEPVNLNATSDLSRTRYPDAVRRVRRRIGPILLVALASGQGTIGVLGVHRERGAPPFEPRDVRLLELFAGKAALAIEQGRARRERQRLVDMEQERARVGLDIGEEVLPPLTVVMMLLELLVEHPDLPHQSPQLASLLNALRESVDRLRELGFDLGADLRQRGLAAALRTHVREEPSPPDLVCRVTSRLRREPPAAQGQVAYRITREALANVRRHARARAAEVLLEERDGGLVVRVTDDGRGFDTSVASTARSAHLGLRAMREQAEEAGGRLRVESTPGMGTLVEVWLPWPG